MLNKSLCQQCNKKRYSICGWTYCDESNWKVGKVWCYLNPAIKKKANSYFYVKDNPPDECPYLLEHLVSRKK